MPALLNIHYLRSFGIRQGEEQVLQLPLSAEADRKSQIITTMEPGNAKYIKKQHKLDLQIRRPF